MKVLDINKLVCEFVGEKEIFAKLGTEDVLTENEQDKVDTMTRCFNLVNQEIASDFLPYLTKEEVSGNIISFESLTKKIVRVYEVRNRFGMNLKFKLFPNFVEVAGKAKTIVYSFLPEDLQLQSDVEMFCGLSARVFAYGIASEYLLICGVDDNAEIWESRFKQSLFMLSQKKGEHVLPKRSWI